MNVRNIGVKIKFGLDCHFMLFNGEILEKK